MSSTIRKVLLQSVWVQVSALLLGACNFVDPASPSNENTAPNLPVATGDDWYLIPGQKREGTLVATDAELDQITYSIEWIVGPDRDAKSVLGATFDPITGVFVVPANSSDPVGQYTVRFTATDNGSPPLSSSVNKQIYVTDELGLGEFLNQAFSCEACHVTGDAPRYRKMQVPCDTDGVKEALYTGIATVPNMQFLGLSGVSDVELVASYHTDVQAIAAYLSSQFITPDYVCSVPNKVVKVVDTLSFPLLKKTGGYTVMMQAVTVSNETLPYPGDRLDSTSYNFSWTPSLAGDYAVNFRITEFSAGTIVFDEIMHISVVLDDVALGKKLYAAHCSGCHGVEGSISLHIYSTLSALSGALGSAIASKPQMLGFSSILLSTEKSSIAAYLCSLNSSCNMQN